MGGKKKKSAPAPATTTGAPSAATGRSGAAAAEEANKQQNSNKLPKSAKENKSKGELGRSSTDRFTNNVAFIVVTTNAKLLSQRSGFPFSKSELWLESSQVKKNRSFKSV